MRQPTACLACRARRRKCEIDVHGLPCTWCTDRNLPCTFSDDNTSRSSSQHLQTPPTTAALRSNGKQNQPSVTLPPGEVCNEIVCLYLQYIHGTSHSIFHRSSLLEDLASGTIPSVILYAIIGLAARFSDSAFFANIEPRLRGRPYIQESERLLNLRDISLSTVQACILLGSALSSEGDTMTEAVYFSIACRNALFLNLPNQLANTALEQEIQNRVWWTLYTTDVWLSNAIGHPYMLPHREDVPFPMEELEFFSLSRTACEPRGPATAEASSLGLFTQMVKLCAIFNDINSVNKSAVVHGFQDQSIIDDLGRRLDQWHRNLPPQLLCTVENLSQHTTFGLGGDLAAVYLGYHHYGQLLYYQYLHEACFDEVLQSRAHEYAERCMAHSIALCEVLYAAYSIPGCEVYYTMVGHVLVIASTVQLHILLFSADPLDVSAAKGRLEHNFQILTKLQSFWPTLDVCFEHFRQFHKACHQSRESSFRMDHWMLQFLFEFGRPVGERDLDDLGEIQPWSIESLASLGLDGTEEKSL